MSKKIIITEIDHRTFNVVIFDEIETSHTVIFDDVMINKYNSINLSKLEIVKKSIEFLLNKEPNTSILSTFDLSIICKYFPEYDHLFDG